MFNLSHAAIWLIFFVSTILGHLGIKFAVDAQNANSLKEVLYSLVSFWGLIGFSWLISAFTWAFILSSQTLVMANSISSLRYVLVLLAGFLVLNERLSVEHFLGAVFICAGIYLATVGS